MTCAAQASRLPTWLKPQITPFFGREALLAVPATLLILLAGLLGNDLLAATIAAGASFAVGFGAARNLRGRRWGAMIAATGGMAAAAFVGSLLGNQFAALAFAAACAAALCAATALYDDDLWWVGLQAVIALLVAGYYAGPPALAAERAGAVLLGGIAQLACVVVVARLVPHIGERLPPAPKPATAPARALLVGHCARAAISVALALAIGRWLGLSFAYWAPMTALLVLKPGLHETLSRGWQRVAGTLGGCMVATIFVEIVGTSPVVLIPAVAVTAGLAYALQKAPYSSLSVAITATVVVLVSMASPHVIANAEHRIVATAIGGGMALIVARCLPPAG